VSDHDDTFGGKKHRLRRRGAEKGGGEKKKPLEFSGNTSGTFKGDKMKNLSGKKREKILKIWKSTRCGGGWEYCTVTGGPKANRRGEPSKLKYDETGSALNRGEETIEYKDKKSPKTEESLKRHKSFRNHEGIETCAQL